MKGVFVPHVMETPFLQPAGRTSPPEAFIGRGCNLSIMEPHIIRSQVKMATRRIVIFTLTSKIDIIIKLYH
jgi:hypothetical protein